MSKSKAIKVSFGHNAEAVTGSYTLIDCGQTGKKILVDFGLIQEDTSLLQEYQMNMKRPDFKPKDIDYIFLTHNHQDHQGRIPLLYKYGCEAPIIIPEGSSDIFVAMAQDSANIMLRDAEDLEKINKKEYDPIYDIDHVNLAIQHLMEYPVGEKIKLDENITFKMVYNGHIFKSVSYIFWIKNGSQIRKIIVTGDLGNMTCKSKFTEDFFKFESCNLLVGEGTYCDGKRNVNSKDRIKDYEKIEALVRTICLEGKGKILIPVFSFGRSPSMLATLYDIFHEKKDFNIPIVYASPLGIRLMKIYLQQLDDENKKYLEEVLSWNNIKLIDNFDDLQKELQDNKPKIYCCASGMMNAGYSVYVASQLLPHSNNAIVFCGHCAEGSLSWKIKQKKQKTITIDGKQIHARCQVTNLNSFSSHAQYDNLIDIYTNDTITIDKIALVHANQKEKLIFTETLQEIFSNKNKTTRVICVNKGTSVNL